MSTSARGSSVKSLRSLYTVVIGVSLSLAVATLIDPKVGLDSITSSSGLLFSAYLVTLFPFYQGALRHLDVTYVESSQSPQDGVFVFDFLLLFIHGLAFVVLSLLIKKPTQFAWMLVGLLSVNVLWGAFAYFTRKNAESAAGKWALINFIFVGVAGIYLYANKITLADASEAGSITLSLSLLFATILRSFADYAWSWSFYMPPNQ